MAGTQVVTSLDADQAVAVMVPALTAGGARITSATATAITGEVETKLPPSGFVALVLLLVMILPGILYMIWGGKKITEPFSVTLTSGAGGTVATASGQGRGLAAAEYAVSLLPT